MMKRRPLCGSLPVEFRQPSNVTYTTWVIENHRKSWISKTVIEYCQPTAFIVGVIGYVSLTLFKSWSCRGLQTRYCQLDVSFDMFSTIWESISKKLSIFETLHLCLHPSISCHLPGDASYWCIPLCVCACVCYGFLRTCKGMTVVRCIMSMWEQFEKWLTKHNTVHRYWFFEGCVPNKHCLYCCLQLSDSRRNHLEWGRV